MSGGSFDYLYSRAPEEAGSLASDVQDMADALAAFPQAQARTAAIAQALRSASVEAAKLAGVWRAVEWHTSGDWSRSSVRSAAIAIGEQLAPCAHAEKNRYSAATEDGLVCEDCGETFNVRPRATKP